MVTETRPRTLRSLRPVSVRPRSAAALRPADEEPALHVVERLRRLARGMLPRAA